MVKEAKSSLEGPFFVGCIFEKNLECWEWCKSCLLTLFKCCVSLLELCIPIHLKKLLLAFRSLRILEFQMLLHCWNSVYLSTWKVTFSLRILRILVFQMLDGPWALGILLGDSIGSIISFLLFIATLEPCSMLFIFSGNWVQGNYILRPLAGNMLWLPQFPSNSPNLIFFRKRKDSWSVIYYSVERFWYYNNQLW